MKGWAVARAAEILEQHGDLNFCINAGGDIVMGVDGLNWLSEHHPDYAGFVIDRNDATLSTPNLADHRLS